MGVRKKNTPKGLLRPHPRMKRHVHEAKQVRSVLGDRLGPLLLERCACGVERYRRPDELTTHGAPLGLRRWKTG